MTIIARIYLLLYVLFFVYGIYAESAPPTWKLTLPEGQGLVIVIVTGTMSLVLRYLEQERRERGGGLGSVIDRIAPRLSVNLAAHERDFYSLWPAQMSMAANNIDITHLGPRPPKHSHGEEEKHYYEAVRQIIKKSKAHVRRVERVTPEKMDWIRRLVEEYKGQKNFSLSAYRDPSDAEMPYALSICRVDESYAWIVAMAEQESTGEFRDLMLTGKHAVEMARRYFQDRLWSRGGTIIDHGVVAADWEQRLGHGSVAS